MYVVAHELCVLFTIFVFCTFLKGGMWVVLGCLDFCSDVFLLLAVKSDRRDYSDPTANV